MGRREGDAGDVDGGGSVGLGAEAATRTEDMVGTVREVGGNAGGGMRGDEDEDEVGSPSPAGRVRG